MRKLLLLLLACALLAAVVAVQVKQRWEAPLRIPAEGLLLTVEPGDSLGAIAYRLQQDGVLADPVLLKAYGRWTGQDQQIKRGEYQVPAGITAEALLLLLNSGEVVQYQVTLPEGITLAQAVVILAAQEELQHVLTGPSDSRITALTEPYTNPEGWFFPDSYRFSRGDTDLSILQRAHRAMTEMLAQEWGQRAETLPYEDPYQALIMASIIERETGLPEERGQIAGVFTRRLSKGMLLQTDPTIIYGLGPEFDGNLRRSHLQDAGNPYNTYRHKGLPPSPIALPGRAAVRAALNPEPGTSLYFVARGDGGHVFSATLAEHNRAVRKYQLQRRKDYRSSPQKQE